MKLTRNDWFGAGKEMKLKLGLAVCLLGMALASVAGAQAVTTTTVQGTVYLANGTPGAGTLSLSWPTFTAAGGQLVTAGHLIATYDETEVHFYIDDQVGTRRVQTDYAGNIEQTSKTV